MKAVQSSAFLPWIKRNQIIITAGETEKITSVSLRSVVFLNRISYASKVGPREPKVPRPVAPGPPKLNKILPFEGCNTAGSLASWSVSVALELVSV